MTRHRQNLTAPPKTARAFRGATAFLALALAAMFLVACGETTTEPTPTVNSVAIDGGDFDLQVGTSATLSATVDVTGGASQDVTWSSSDDAVATVDAATGEVTAQGTAGQTADITATSDADAGVSDTVTVTLTDAPVTTVSSLDASIVLGSQVDLTWTAANADSIDVVCDDGAGGAETTLEGGLPGGTAGTIVSIPASDCQTVRVYARGAENDDSVEVALTGVVLNGNDDGPGSLRAVYAAASAGDVIGFASDVTEVVLSDKDFVGSNEAHMVLDADVTISGPTAAPVTIRSDDTLADDSAGIPVQRTRVFYVPTITTTQLDGLVISGGTFIAAGAGVRNDGTLTISNSVIENNRAYYRGGGIVNLGTLTIENSAIQNNRAEVNDAESAAGFFCIDDITRSCDDTDDGIYFEFGEGGSGAGLYNQAGTTTIVDSTIDGNTAIFSGGGIYVEDGSVDVTDTTISNNVASDADVTEFSTYSFGGGVANFVDAGYAMTGGSIEDNLSANVGGGLSNGSSSFVDLAIELADVTVTLNEAGEFGGGYIHYYQAEAPGPDGTYTVTETGTTSVTGNTAGLDGNNRFFSEVTGGGGLLAPAQLTSPSSPSEAFDER